MRISLRSPTVWIVGTLAGACGLAMAGTMVALLGGLDQCRGSWGAICGSFLSLAVPLFVLGMAAWSRLAAWGRKGSPPFRWLYAGNVLFAMAIAPAAIWSIWKLGAGPDWTLAASIPLTLLLTAMAWFVNSSVEKDRCSEMARWARRHGLGFNAEDAPGLGQRFLWSKPFGPSPGGAACNVIHGVIGAWGIILFDYRRTPEAAEDRAPVGAGAGPLDDMSGEMSVVMVSFREHRFPGCVVASKDALGPISRTVMLENIDLESDEFNRHYGVWASDRKFAYDVVDPRMMEFLLANPGWAFEVAGPDVMVYTGKRWAPGQFGPAIRALTGFVERIPAHVLANWCGLAREVFGDKAMAGVPGAGEGEPG